MKLLVCVLVVIAAANAARQSFPSTNMGSSQLMQLLQESLHGRRSGQRPQAAPKPSSSRPGQILSSLQDLMQRSGQSKRYGSYAADHHPNLYTKPIHGHGHESYNPPAPVPQYKYTPKKYFYYSVHDPLSNKDIKDTLLQLLYEAHLVAKDDTLTDEDLDTLWHILNIFRDVQFGTTEESKCPYGFTRSENLCLCGTSEVPEEPDLTFDIAREICQEKGGDLAIYRDANEFVAIRQYLLEIDPEFTESYAIGAKQIGDAPIFFIDGTILPQNDGIFKPDSSLAVRTDPDGSYAILDKDENFRPTSGEISETIPLCQYIKARDGKISRQRRPSGIGEHLGGNQYHPVWETFPYEVSSPHQKNADSGDKTASESLKTSRIYH